MFWSGRNIHYHFTGEQGEEFRAKRSRSRVRGGRMGEKFIKCISIQQPWAWAIFHGKPVENRTWKTDYRGDLLIHASKVFDYEGFLWLLNHRSLVTCLVPGLNAPDYISGAIIGKVTMTDIVITHPSPFFFGPYGHVYADPIEFKTPIPFKGKLKFFDVPDELLKGVL